jgi:hypothetical protein
MNQIVTSNSPQGVFLRPGEGNMIACPPVPGDGVRRWLTPAKVLSYSTLVSNSALSWKLSLSLSSSSSILLCSTCTIGQLLGRNSCFSNLALPSLQSCVPPWSISICGVLQVILIASNAITWHTGFYHRRRTRFRYGYRMSLGLIILVS